MPAFMRHLLISATAACFALTLGAAPAEAKPVHHHKHHAKTHHHVAKSKGNDVIRVAQRHLATMGYYVGSVDGIMGKNTRAAIKNFQRDHNLKVDGVLGPKTRAALESTDPMTKPLPPVVIDPNAVTHPDYTTNLGGNPKIISSRYGRLDVSEVGSGEAKRYVVNLNGESILVADGQPSVIGMSQAYNLGQEDAVIFTTYSPSDTGCTYRTHVLAMDASGSKILDIGNCTRDYQASVNQGSLYITFPERDDARAVGSTWRVEGEVAERL